ncbi:MAG: hypothetical protein RLO51_17865 [Thalassobaculum sp.]
MDETAFRSGIRMHADGAQRPAVPSPCPRSGAFATTTTTKAGKTTL